MTTLDDIPSHLRSNFRRARVRLDRVIRDQAAAKKARVAGPSALELDTAVGEHVRAGMALAKCVDALLEMRARAVLAKQPRVAVTIRILGPTEEDRAVGEQLKRELEGFVSEGLDA